jgi:glycogen debranching enzyme-like protein
MDDELIILDGCTFMYSDARGDVDAPEAEGFYYQDVRHLARWVLRLDGSTVEPLTSRRVDYYSARVVATRETGTLRPSPSGATGSSARECTRRS